MSTSDPRANGRPTNNVAPPGAWVPAHHLARRILAPVERFLAVEAASGVLLLLVSVVALVWANSPWRASYEALWHTPIGARVGPWSFERDLHFWVNDGLMTIFFFVVGLEIRRETHRGELSELRRATLPLAAALGGMVLPAAIYALVNGPGPAAAGWGVPMATDIAFAVGVLALLGDRVAPALRILLLALAVIDDVGAILVIAIFYSGSISLAGLAVAAAGVGGILVLQKFGVRSPFAYILPSVVVWAGAYAGGVHPTLAGVLVGFLTPVHAWFGAKYFTDVAEESVRSLRERIEGPEDHLHHELDALSAARREAISPLERIQHALHRPVAFGVMPLFALANAGVPVGGASFESDGVRVFLGVTLGLVVGKPLGVMGLSWLASRVGLTLLPRGVQWGQVLVVGLCAGIGFTMALFVAGLAFEPGPLLETAKLAILCGSALSGALAYAVGRATLRRPDGRAAATEAEAEASSEV